ncbi:TGA transcription factor [Trema orientale]|uniref:TGA transcription factor n=1 Tax=Trema orientale TaxID=63057 RepID=A0A2P5F585_TREOI|nr:TGA transcription factor [Trema orientale]
MLKSGVNGLFSKKKTTSRSRPFSEYYSEWFNLLKNSLLPRLRLSIHGSSIAQLSTQVDVVRAHFHSYYDALDLAAQDDGVAQLLFPAWRNPLEKPFLWLGDLHPYLFTNLLRSFLENDDANEEEDDDHNDVVFEELAGRVLGNDELFNRPWHIVMAWKNPSEALMGRIEQIECGLRLMVPALVARARKAQAGFVEAVAEDWARRREAAEEAVGRALTGQMEEVVGVFVDANRLRRSVLAEIAGATSVYQAALFLEGLAQFLVGFRDPDLVAEFESCKVPLSKISRFQSL